MSLHPLLLFWRAVEIQEHPCGFVRDRIFLGYRSVLNVSQAALEVLPEDDILSVENVIAPKHWLTRYQVCGLFLFTCFTILTFPHSQYIT